MIPVTLVTEDVLSNAVARSLLDQASQPFDVDRELPGRGSPRFAGGSGQIEKKIIGFNNAAQRTPFLVMLDLDARDCAAGYRSTLLPTGASRYMILRIAVREIESWLLADRSGFASYLGVSEAVVPRNPDELIDAKGELFSIVLRSRKRALKEAILPVNKTARIGPDYNGSLIHYLQETWSRDRAMRHSASLQRAVDALEAFQYP